MLKRFSFHQRIAHFIGSISGMVLMVTGLPIMFSKQLGWLINLFGGSAVTMFIHRLFAIILIFSFAYFGTYFVLERIKRGRGDSNIKNFGLSMEFISEVVAGAVRDVLWTLGLRKERPKFGKYDWIMVADIYGMPIFALIEIVTGAMMWFPRSFPFIVENPGLFFAVRSIHAGVAFFLVLFVLAHAGILHLTPGNFPINMSIFSGLMSKKKAMHEHPNWVDLAEDIGGEDEEDRTHPICYLFGAITTINIVLLAYIPFIMYSEGFAGLRIGDDTLASVGLCLAILTLMIYIVVSVFALIKGIARRG